METASSITQTHRDAGAELIAFGPAEAGIEIAESLGSYEAEYAAIRRFTGLLHEPQRAVLRLTGADRQDYLHRMVTQDIRAMTPGQSRRSFQLNETGRILADMIVHHGGEDTWLEMDRFDLPGVKQLLDGRLFSEDVGIEDWTWQREAMALHGPVTGEALATLAGDAGKAMFDMPGTHHVLNLDGVPVTAYRHDVCGVPGVRMLVPREQAAGVYARVLDTLGFRFDAPDPQEDPEAAAEAMAQRRGSLRGRPIGWLAFNTARIEAGSPLYHVDFGPDSLPAETGLLDEAVSFRKGCYLGQEIVARMAHLGHPKRVLVGLRMVDERLPVAGSQVFEARTAGATGGAVIGAVTSSTLSPVRGNAAVALAVVKWGRHGVGTEVAVPAEGELVTATVGPMRSLPA